MRDYVISTQCRAPDDLKPGEYHYPKLDKTDAVRLEEALQNNALIKGFVRCADPDGDTVGYSFFAPDDEVVLTFVRDVLGNGHDLTIIGKDPECSLRMRPIWSIYSGPS